MSQFQRAGERSERRQGIPKGPQASPRGEYLRRIAAVKSEMEWRDIGALVVTFNRGINYLAGYTARSGYIPQALAVLAADEEPTTIRIRPSCPVRR